MVIHGGNRAELEAWQSWQAYMKLQREKTTCRFLDAEWTTVTGYVLILHPIVFMSSSSTLPKCTITP